LPDLISPLPCPSTRSHAWNLGQCRPKATWPRRKPAWYPYWVPSLACSLARDVAAFGEVYSRVTWSLGGALLCTRHQCLLISECPRCFRQADYQPINGRLRIWCGTCAAGADSTLPPELIPFWPYGTPQQHRSCRAVSLSSVARPLLLRVQTDLLALLAGARPRGPRARALPWASAFDVLRKLTFVMLGPLWEGAHQAVPAQSANNGPGLLSETWTPGSLPPQIAAPALLAAVTFLAAESSTRLTGITWHRDLLIDGEDDAITADTLLWHLDRGDARLVQDLFAVPLIRPFALLLAALRADRPGLGAAREATRLRTGIGAALRRARETLSRHQDEKGHVGYRTSRFSISRLSKASRQRLARRPRHPNRARHGRKRSRFISFWAGDRRAAISWPPQPTGCPNSCATGMSVFGFFVTGIWPRNS
jgi:hypothetical protein